ncbi:FAS1 domain-containing protein [Xylariaceae sp. FL0662B]|nr:FAS1 domain-containing protein [Xylariaceae sp. FL0662B]
MRYTSLLPLLASATSVVIPDEHTAQNLVLNPDEQAVNRLSSWRDKLPTLDSLHSSAEDTLNGGLDAFERHVGKLGHLSPKIDLETDDELRTDFLSPLDQTNTPSVECRGHHGSTNLTVYESIKASNFTKKFAALIDDYPDIVKKLNSTSANVTAFIPIDRAFDKIPDHHKEHKPPREVVERILEYHILPGSYPAGRVLAHHTLPTALEEEHLGGRPQRLRVSVGLFGVKLNFYSKLIVANLHCKNGIAHGIDSILVPPPSARKLISLFPTKFSTLELAAEKIGFGHHRHEGGDGDEGAEEKLTGLTFFAPTNTAFQKLGPAANAFLFNTPKGLGYLKALLKYHIVVNETLYSDEYYGKQTPQPEVCNDDEDGRVQESRRSVHHGQCAKHERLLFQQSGDDVQQNSDGTHHNGHHHLDLPTLLDDKSIAVDIARWYGFIKFKLNGQVEVAVQDGLARNGVVQVVNTVLIPPHEHKHKGDLDGEISVEELMERLGPYVEEEEKVDIGEL